MQEGSYIYYCRPGRKKLPGRIVRFGDRRICIALDTGRELWVSEETLDEKRVRRMLSKAGRTCEAYLDVVHYDGKPVVRFDPPCTCELTGMGISWIKVTGRAPVAGADNCPVHGFGAG